MAVLTDIVAWVCGVQASNRRIIVYRLLTPILVAVPCSRKYAVLNTALSSECARLNPIWLLPVPFIIVLVDDAVRFSFRPGVHACSAWLLMIYSHQNFLAVIIVNAVIAIHVSDLRQDA